MRIAICDDEEYQIGVLIDYLRPYQKVYPKITISGFTSGEDLLKAYEDGQTFDFIFLDVQLKALDGLKTAEIIRESDRRAIIIFVSSYQQYVFHVFHLHAFHYILKPVKLDAFISVFDRAIEEYLSTHYKYVVKWNHRYTSLSVQEIHYVEGYYRHIIVHTDHDEYKAVGKLNDAELRLRAHGFIRVHQGFLVNMRHIRSVEQTYIQMVNGEKVDLSFRKRKDVLSQYNKFLTECSI